MRPLRCVGTLHGEVGDCRRPIVGALLCYGYLDRDQGVPLQDSVDGPVPMLFGACASHKAPLAEWAEHLWGRIAEGIFVEPAAIPDVLKWMRAEDEPVVLSPDARQAVGIH